MLNSKSDGNVYLGKLRGYEKYNKEFYPTYKFGYTSKFEADKRLSVYQGLNEFDDIYFIEQMPLSNKFESFVLNLLRLNKNLKFLKPNGEYFFLLDEEKFGIKELRILIQIEYKDDFRNEFKNEIKEKIEEEVENENENESESESEHGNESEGVKKNILEYSEKMKRVKFRGTIIYGKKNIEIFIPDGDALHRFITTLAHKHFFESNFHITNSKLKKAGCDKTREKKRFRNQYLEQFCIPTGKEIYITNNNNPGVYQNFKQIYDLCLENKFPINIDNLHITY